MKVSKYSVDVHINPLRSGSKRKQNFTVTAEDEDYALAEFRRCFKHFANDHRWHPKPIVDKITKIKGSTHEKRYASPSKAYEAEESGFKRPSKSRPSHQDGESIAGTD